MAYGGDVLKFQPIETPFLSLKCWLVVLEIPDLFTKGMWVRMGSWKRTHAWWWGLLWRNKEGERTRRDSAVGS